jgi:hypothetical protein
LSSIGQFSPALTASLARLPEDDLALMGALKDFLRAACAHEGLSDAAATAFLLELRSEALGLPARAPGGGGSAAPATGGGAEVLRFSHTRARWCRAHMHAPSAARILLALPVFGC